MENKKPFYAGDVITWIAILVIIFVIAYDIYMSWETARTIEECRSCAPDWEGIEDIKIEPGEEIVLETISSTPEEENIPQGQNTMDDWTIEDIIEEEGSRAGLDQGEIARLKRIAWCESTYDPEAVNPSSSASGLFQILYQTWISNTDYSWEDRFDPVINTRAAIEIYQEHGFNQWVCK